MQAGILILCLSFLVQALIAQETAPSSKGAKPIQISNYPLSNNTYAVVVGISDYQDPDISDLRFGDKDAIAFAAYLQSRAGGSLDGEHLILLLDSAATMAAFASSLDWLKTVAKAGDRVIIYFSGHGDLETKINNELGFLLCYDAASRVYSASGAFPLYTLQEIVASLSTKNSAKVILIADACHSGALAGNSIGGQHITTENLKAFHNDIKILSCQPYEFSIEGEQWGGGRGAFSYHLIDALYGMADDNKDEWVTLQEAGRYLEDHVSQDVAPIQQVPTVSGERLERLAMVDTFLLSAIKQGKTSQVAMLAPIESRSEDIIIASADTSIQKIYKQFKRALKDKIFLEPSNPADSGFAELYYQQLVKDAKLESLYATIRRNYATALQDDAQQVLNGLLKVDVNEITRSKVSKLKKYKNYPAYLNRAAELLGKEHFFYNKLKAREYFFEGYLSFLINSGNKDEAEGKLIMEKYRQSLNLEPNSSQTYFFMMYCQAMKFVNKDSTLYFGKQAADYSPGWILPYTYLSFFFSYKFRDLLLAKIYLDKAMEIDSQNVMFLFTKASWYFYKEDYLAASKLYQSVVGKDSANTIARLNAGIVNYKLKNYNLAVKYLLEYIRLDSLAANGFYYLGLTAKGMGDEESSENYFKKAMLLSPTHVNNIRELAKLYRKQNKNDQAEELYLKMLTFEFDKKPIVLYELACLSSLKNRPDEAIQYLGKALSSGFTNINELWNAPELQALKNFEAFKSLIEKYQK